jgi:hypothetical protein
MDHLQNDIWAHLGHMPDEVLDGSSPAAPGSPEAALVVEEALASAGPQPAPPGEQRGPEAARRRFDRGGRRRSDWPDDAGMTCCPGCGFESIQSLGMLDSGDYLWQCPHCDRRFHTGRATRTML